MSPTLYRESALVGHAERRVGAYTLREFDIFGELEAGNKREYVINREHRWGYERDLITFFTKETSYDFRKNRTYPRTCFPFKPIVSICR